MDAQEFFQKIAKPNYDAAKEAPDDLRLLWNAVVSLNTAAEFIALHRLNYPTELGRNRLFTEAKKIRSAVRELELLNECAITFKHVRRIKKTTQLTPPEGLTASSTSFDSGDTSTWSIAIDGLEYEVVTVLHDAFQAITRPPGPQNDSR